MGSSELDGCVTIVRMMDDKQLVGIFYNVDRNGLMMWADTVVNTDLCEYAVIDKLIMVWPGKTSPIPYPDGYCEDEDDPRPSGYPGALFDGPTAKQIESARWHPLEDGSFVYFAKAGNRVKIGKANNVNSRLSTLQTGCPDRLVLLKVERGGRDAERSYHIKFAHLRENGEWFRHEADLAEFLGGSAP